MWTYKKMDDNVVKVLEIMKDMYIHSANAEHREVIFIFIKKLFYQTRIMENKE